MRKNPYHTILRVFSVIGLIFVGTIIFPLGIFLLGYFVRVYQERKQTTVQVTTAQTGNFAENDNISQEI